MEEARADTTTNLEAHQVSEDSLNRSSVVEAATTTTSTVTNTDLPAVEDLVRSLANSSVEATTTTSSILEATTTMDHREALADLRAWPAHSWGVAALPTTTSLADSTDRTRTKATVEVAVHTAAATSSSMDLAKVTVAAAAAVSSAVSWAATSRTIALAATAILQEEAPAVPTLVLHHQARISPKDSLTMANPVRDTALTVALHRQTHTSPRDSPTTANLVKATALTVVQHLRALLRSLVLTIRLVETNRMDNNPTVGHNRADMGDTSSSQTPMVDLLSSTVAMTKAVTAALVVLEVTTSNREATANLKADTVDTKLLLEATEVEDTSNSMATAVTEGDLPFWI